MYLINSLTDTTGVRSPQSAGCDTRALAEGGGVGADDEHAAIVAARRTRPL
jgi:hypothetical protein